ncbi:hypothetical protein BGZ94_001997 [Podila epigama]|nr:hypothetical protein BGZ94_001997 [Podila epigama]
MLRIVTQISVRTLRPQRASSAMVLRAYSTEGMFKQKEKAAEDIYIRAKEAEQVKALKEKLAKAEKELDILKKAPKK